MASTVRITELRKVPAFRQWWNDITDFSVTHVAEPA
jgi:hypothetical protein